MEEDAIASRSGESSKSSTANDHDVLPRFCGPQALRTSGSAEDARASRRGLWAISRTEIAHAGFASCCGVTPCALSSGIEDAASACSSGPFQNCRCEHAQAVIDISNGQNDDRRRREEAASASRRGAWDYTSNAKDHGGFARCCAINWVIFGMEAAAIEASRGSPVATSCIAAFDQAVFVST